MLLGQGGMLSFGHAVFYGLGGFISIYALIGPNCAGKSTLFNLISGFYEVSSGYIELNGHTITNLLPHQVNRFGLTRSFQVTNIFPKMSVFENIRCALLWPMGYCYSFWHLCGRLKRLNEKAEEILEKIHMIDIACPDPDSWQKPLQN